MTQASSSQGKTPIRETALRADVQVRLPDGRVFEAPRSTPLKEILRAAFPDRTNPPVAAVIGGEDLRELAWPVDRDVDVSPVFLSDSDGVRIYRRSLSFLLVVATYELYPFARVYIDYSVPHGGYFCRVEGRKPFTPNELGAIKERMQELVHEDLPIVRARFSIDDARRMFAARGEERKVELLMDRRENHIHLYTLNGISDYFFGYMVPSTGALRVFALEPYSTGFILRFPRREQPDRLLASQKFTALREVFDEYGKWLDRVGIRDVSALNRAIRSGRIEQVIMVSEALHERRIAGIAGQLARAHDDGIRIAFIAGPSSSGKTTVSKRLAVQLLAGGLQPYPIEMDGYFVPRDELRRRYGDAVDFDALSALDLDLFREDIAKLLRGEPVTLPRYNFITGGREAGRTAHLEPNELLLVEGIHGLNPAVIPNGADGICYRIFVSALTQLNLDIHNRISTTDTRLIRRIVRDARYRGYTAEDTLRLWEGVRVGEKSNIFPYQEGADVMFNSALGYELSILKPLAEPLLLQVRDPILRLEAERLLAFLRWFEPYSTGNIPGNSILREFIGGSILRDFTPAPVLPPEE